MKLILSLTLLLLSSCSSFQPEFWAYGQYRDDAEIQLKLMEPELSKMSDAKRSDFVSEYKKTNETRSIVITKDTICFSYPGSPAFKYDVLNRSHEEFVLTVISTNETMSKFVFKRDGNTVVMHPFILRDDKYEPFSYVHYLKKF
jgi:hypothetical protein